MSKTITIDILDRSSAVAAGREIRGYTAQVKSKVEELRQKVAQAIAKDARTMFGTAVVDDFVDGASIISNVNVIVEDRGKITVVIAVGDDAVFVEFGAGVHHNGPVGSSPHPLGEELGYTIGSYGKGNGAKNVWGYKDADGILHLTHGAPASMPMYKSMMGVVNDIERIAKEVFGA